MIRHCCMCGAEHIEERADLLLWRGGPTKIEVVVYSCSESCRDDLRFTVPPDVPDAQRAAAIAGMVAGT